MKVHLIKRQTIEDFAKANARSRSSFEDWLEKLKYADWNTPTDIGATFGATDLLAKVLIGLFLKSAVTITV